MINRIIGKLAESDNALVDRKRVNIREALNKIDCEHYTDFLNLYECAELSLDKKKALAQELVKEEVDLKVIESFFDEDDYADAMEDGYWEDRIEQEADKTIYNKLKEILPPEHIDNHETDLYVVVCPESTRILKDYEYKANITRFEDEDGIEWYDIPFAYDPAWDEKLTESKSLLETGEWEDDEEGIAWKEQLLDLIHSYTTFDNIELEDIEGFDKYQGPYAYDSGLEFWLDNTADFCLLIHNVNYTQMSDSAWYRICSREDFDKFEQGNLEPLKENLKEDVSHTYDGNLKEGDIYYTITVFEEKGKYGHSLEPSSPEDAFDELYFTSPSEAQEYADKHYPNAYSIMIRENNWNEGERTSWVSGPYLQRLNGEWKLFNPNSIKESSIPRNAKTITATPRDGGASMKLTKKDGVWLDGKYGYDNSFLRNHYDIKVDEVDPNYKPNRTKRVAVLQGNYGYGWDDLAEYEPGSRELKVDLKAYRENELNADHRVIYRRIPVDTQE
jgi:hypothetical protein